MVFSYLDKAADDFGNMINFPGDQIQLVVCLLISYPVGFIFKRIPNVTVRHIFAIGLGIFYQYLIYRDDTIHPLILWLFTYGILKFTGRRNAVLIFAVAILYLSALHFRSMIRDWGGYNIDVTGSMMLSVSKCTSFAWNYKDGGVDDNKLSAEQRKKKLYKLPSLLEYFSFVCFYGSVLVGPACDYKDYEEFINKRGDYKGKYKTFTYSFGYLICGIASMGLIVFFGSQFNAPGTLTKEYAERSFLGKYWYMTVAMFLVRSKYYTAWLISTANVTAAGLNYNPNGLTQAQKFGKIVAVRPLEFERYDNIKDKLEAWNTASQLWLKNYVYFRVCSEEEAKLKPTKAAFASNVTFMISAFWHGFYPGYYLGFFFMFLVQQIAKSLYRIRAKLRFIPEPFAFALRWLLSRFCIDVFGTVFNLLELGKSLTFLRALNFAPFIIVGVLYVLLHFTPLGKGARSAGPKKAKDADGTPATHNATNTVASEDKVVGGSTKKDQ